MRTFGFNNGNGKSEDYNLKFLSFPTFSYGSEVLEEKTIPGRVGTVVQKTGRYTDTVISNPLEFESKSIETFYEDEEAIRAWLQSSTKLVYSDKEDKFFIVKKVEIGDVKRKHGVYGEFVVDFICNPSVYLVDGQKEISHGTINNAHSWSQPIYKITGEGVCNLTVNGVTIRANVAQNLTIDTEKMIAYRSDGTLVNTSISGDYEDLYLQPGENTVSVTSGFTCKIIPNWRCL